MEASPRRSFRPASVSALPLLLFFAPLLLAQAGVITTAAGPSLNDSSVSGASLIEPTGVAVDSAGNIYTADPYNCVVWKTHYGVTSVFTGILPSTQYSCTGPTPLAYPVAVAQCNGNVFVASNGLDPFVVGGGVNDTGGTVDEVSSGGSLSALPLPSTGGGAGAGPLHPVSVACDAGGNVYVSSYFYISDGGFASNVNEFSPATGGGWTTGAPVSGLFDQAYTALAVNPTNGDLYGLLAGSAGEGWLGRPMFDFGSIWDITKNATGITSNNTFNNPSALAIDSNGNFYIAQGAQGYELASYVDYVLPDGTTTVIAGTGSLSYFGDGGLSTLANVFGVSGIALDPTNRDIYLADSGNMRVRRIHSLTAGPSALNLVPQSAPQSSSAAYGSLQGALNPINGDFYYVTGSNTVNVINTGSSVISPGYERLIASISVGAAGPVPNGSALTMVIDSTRNLVYVSNTTDGNLYVIDGSTHTVVGSVTLDNPNASLVAVDTALNEVYAGGPNATKVSAVRGGTSPQLIGNAGYPVNSLSVDVATDVVYAVADSGAGGAQQEAFITMTPDPVTGVLAVSITTFPADEVIVQPAFIANSIAADPLTGSLIAAGAASINTGFAQGYYVYDIFQFDPTFVTAPVLYTWPPLTTSLDIPNRAFYVTDFDGLLSDPSSHTAMVTGIDGVAAENNSLVSVTIPVFGSGATPSSPHIYEAQPDTSSYQAWISGSDATDGGFVRLWDAGTQKLTLSVSIPDNGGGHLFVNSSAQSAYLLDEVNGQLWLIDTPQWTPTPAPEFTQTQNGQSVTISAAHSGDAVYYTLDGTAPGLESTPCSSPCMVGLTVGEFTTINAIEVATVSEMQIASNVEQGVFTEPAATNLAITLSPNPTTGATLTATATITPSGGISTVTGSVSFTATPSGSSTPVSLCSGVSITNNMGSWQAVCNFVEDYAGSYTIAATYSGDALNQGSSNTAQLSVAQGTTPILFTISDPSTALAINSNNSPGLAYNAVLNTDSSVSLLMNGAILSEQGCPAFDGLSSSVNSGAVYVDFANSNIYLAMLTGSGLYAAYESINQTTGACTQGPLLLLSGASYGTMQMDVDTTAFSSQLGNMYVMMAYGGGITDALYVVPTAPWTASSLPTPAELTLDYSTQYGPMVIDPSNHQLYINDLGGSASGTVGTYATGGFFVYDPTHSATPANNLLHITGYINGSVTTRLYAGTLLNNGAGKLVLVNENPSASANLSIPITILDTTKFSFFNNSGQNITPGAGLSTISAVSQYTAIGGADIDAANNVVYAFGFNSSSLTTPGLLLEYNLSPTASPQETVLSGSTPMPNLGYSVPWSRMNYNPVSTELALSANIYSSSGFALTSPLCAGTPLSLTQVAGSAANPVLVGYPVVNTTSGYVYAIQSGAIDYVAPPPGCSTLTVLQISPATIPYAFAGESYFESFTATGGSGTGYTWSVTSGTALSAVGLSLTSAGVISGYPNAPETAAPFTVKVTDSQGNTGTQNYTLTVYPASSVTPTTLPAGVVGTPYSQALTASGGAGGPFTFSVVSGTALSAVGLSLSSAGLIAGTPNATETAAPFTLQVADSLGNFIHLNYTLTINAVTPLTISPTTLPAGTAGTPYAQTLTATGGSGTGYSWTIISGGTSLGNIGLTLSSAAATIIGATPVAGQANFTVQVTDSLNNTATQNYTLTINPVGGQPAKVMDNETITLTDSVPDTSDSETITVTDKVNVGGPLAITTAASAPNGVEGVPYAPITLFTASGGTPPYTWSVTGQPAGLIINTSTGVVSGTPTVDGEFLLTVTVTDSLENSVFAETPLTVTPPAPIANLNPTSLAFSAQTSGTQSAAQTVTLSNTGSAPLSLSGTGLGISISGANATDFAQSSPSCGTSVAAGANCAINVTFTPSLSIGSETAILNVADNAGGSPQQVQLSGIALPPASVSCTIPTISLSGDSGTATITCTATDFTGTIALDCNLPTSLSKYVSCGFSPSSLNFASGSTASTTLTIQAVKDTSASLERRSRPWAAPTGGVALGAVLWLPASALVMRRKKGRSKRGLLLMLILLCGLPMISSCGGKTGPPTPPSGTYQASITLTGPGLNQTITFTIQEP